MLKKVGLRTIKTAIGAGLALYISTLLELDFAMFSAIILIMCIERTKRKTLLTIGEKFFASLLGLALSGLIFELLSYHPLVLGIFILLFIPVLVRLRIQAGFVTSMVVVLHVYSFSDFTLQVVKNELSIIAIGMGLALLINSVMPSFKEDLHFVQRSIEGKLATIWKRFALSLRDNAAEWDGREIFELEDMLKEAKEMALKEIENRFLKEERQDLHYIEMREDQVDLLRQMLKVLAVISTSDLPVQERIQLAEFMEHTSLNVHSGDTTEESLRRLEEMMEDIRRAPLPSSREEFEVRANLYYLVFEMENYFKIKRELFA